MTGAGNTANRDFLNKPLDEIIKEQGKGGRAGGRAARRPGRDNKNKNIDGGRRGGSNGRNRNGGVEKRTSVIGKSGRDNSRVRSANQPNSLRNSRNNNNNNRRSVPSTSTSASSRIRQPWEAPSTSVLPRAPKPESLQISIRNDRVTSSVPVPSSSASMSSNYHDRDGYESRVHQPARPIDYSYPPVMMDVDQQGPPMYSGRNYSPVRQQPIYHQQQQQQQPPVIQQPYNDHYQAASSSSSSRSFYPNQSRRW